MVKAIGSSAIVRNGQKVPGKFTVTDDSGKARCFVGLYSGGAKVGKGASRGLQPAKGGRRGREQEREGTGVELRLGLASCDDSLRLQRLRHR